MSSSLTRRLNELEKKANPTSKTTILLVERLGPDGESLDPDFEDRLAEAQRSRKPYIVLRTNVWPERLEGYP